MWNAWVIESLSEVFGRFARFDSQSEGVPLTIADWPNWFPAVVALAQCTVVQAAGPA
jgi:hypothetical protein